MRCASHTLTACRFLVSCCVYVIDFTLLDASMRSSQMIIHDHDDIYHFRRRQMASLNEALESMERAVGAITEREAVKIQRAWRAHMERKSRQERLRASLTIQAHWRAGKLRRQRKEMSAWMQDILDDVVDAAVQRGEEFYEKLNASAKVIQRYVRYVRRWKREKDAAITIQRATHIFLDRLRHEREEERLRQEEERERKLDAIEQELFGKSLAKYGIRNGEKISRGPFRSGHVSLKVDRAMLGDDDADATSNQSGIADGAFALLLPGRIAFFEDHTCTRQLASVALARARAMMDEGLLRSDDYHFKIKLCGTRSETATGFDAARNEVVFASKTVGDQAKWFKAIMEEVEIAKAYEFGQDHAEGETSFSFNADETMQGWLTTQHNTRIFAVRYQGGILGFHNPSCRDVAVVIPVVSETTFTKMTTAPSPWFTLNNGDIADMLRADTDEASAQWVRSFPSSPTTAALKLDAPPILEGFLGVYRSPQGFATTYGPAHADPRCWRRLYAVLCYTSIRFFEDARCAKAAGELLLHSMYVHPTDKRSLVSTGVDGMEYGFRMNRPGVTQLIVATATADEARAWIEAVESLGNGYSGHLTARERSSPASKKANLWKAEDELHHSSDSVTDTDGTISSPPRYAMTRSPLSVSPKDPLRWKASLHHKLLGSPFWSSSPETRRFAMVGLKSEISLEKQLRRT